jgi:hypothetical protein
MEQHRIPKKVLGSCFGGGRSVGRPQNRWEDVIQRDAANLLQIQNWKAVARDEEEWRKKVGQPWPEKGLKRHRRKRRYKYNNKCISMFTRLLMLFNTLQQTCKLNESEFPETIFIIFLKILKLQGVRLFTKFL